METTFWSLFLDRFFQYVRENEERAELRGAMYSRIASKLGVSTRALKDAIAEANNPTTTDKTPGGTSMATANPVIDGLIDQVNKTQDVMASGTTLINGIADRVQAAVDQALANGATAEQLAPVQAEVDELKARTQEMADAIAANTPAQPSGQTGGKKK